MLAKDGAQGLGTEDPLQVPLSASTFSTTVDTFINKTWNERWQKGKDARQTKIFFPEINLKRSKELRSLSRNNLRLERLRDMTSVDDMKA